MSRSSRTLLTLAAAVAGLAAPLAVPGAAIADAGAPIYQYQDAWYTPTAQASDPTGDVKTLAGGKVTDVATTRAADLSWVDVGVSSIPGQADTTGNPGRFIYVDIGAHDNRAAMSAPFVDFSATFAWTTKKKVTKGGKTTTNTVKHKSVFAYHVNDYYPQGSDIWRTATRDGKKIACDRSWSFHPADYSTKGAVSRFTIPASCIGSRQYVVSAQARIRATNAHTAADAVDTAGPVVVNVTDTAAWNTYQAEPSSKESAASGITAGKVAVGKYRTTVTSTYATAPTFVQGKRSYLVNFADGVHPDRTWWFSVTTDDKGANPSFYTYDSASSSFRWSCSERDARFAINGTKVTLSIPNDCFGDSAWVTAKVPGIRYASPAVPLPVTAP